MLLGILFILLVLSIIHSFQSPKDCTNYLDQLYLVALSLLNSFGITLIKL